MQLRDLIDLKQMQRSQLTPAPRKFDLRKLVKKVTCMNQMQADLADLVIQPEIQEDTPDFIIGEKMRTAQILHNSLYVALHHASKNSPVEVHCFVMPQKKKDSGNLFMAVDFELDLFSDDSDRDSQTLIKDFELGLQSSKHLS